MSKDDMISYLAVLIIVVSLASIGMRLTGYANVTDTGKVNVTIDTSAALNFTVDYLDFGNGTVDGGYPGAYLYTNGTSTIHGNWIPISDNLTLENIGNTNLTLWIYANGDANSFLGGTNPEFKYAVTEDEAGSCNGAVNRAVGQGAYYDINTSNFTICTQFPFDNSKDELALDFMLYIPDDSYIGERLATIVAVGQF